MPHSTQAEEEQRRKDFAALDAAAESDPRHIEARWAGEAAKAWWCNLSETERQRIETMEPNQVFILGWKCGRAKAADPLKP